MGYGVVFEPGAEADLDRIAARSPLAASFVLDQIDLLAENPTALALKPSFPHPLLPKYQFWGPSSQGFLHFTVLFRYSQDERFLRIVGIGMVEYPDRRDLPD